MISECVSCVPRVFLHASVVYVALGIEILDVLDIRFVWLRSYESLLTYVAHMDLVEIRFKIPATHARPRYSLLKYIRSST